MFNPKLFLLFLAVVMCSWQLKLDQEKQVAFSLLFFQMEPYKNGFFLVLPSILLEGFIGTKTKRILEFL